MEQYRIDNEIITYRAMCDREDVQTLQRGMNFRLNGNRSVILMSLRSNAPYRDKIENGGKILIYEGHDAPRLKDGADPKAVDQPEFTPLGKLTQNGMFHRAAQEFKQRGLTPEHVQVYQKLWNGIWTDNGIYILVDSWREKSGRRNVFKFKLELLENSDVQVRDYAKDIEHSRIIPAVVKQQVWMRDKGQCVICGSHDNLHFDHIIPYSKGGSSLTAENIQLLCVRHNLRKHDKIE
jgi:hypothetical protein